LHSTNTLAYFNTKEKEFDINLLLVKKNWKIIIFLKNLEGVDKTDKKLFDRKKMFDEARDQSGGHF
jgi:hypothetical protein